MQLLTFDGNLFYQKTSGRESPFKEAFVQIEPLDDRQNLVKLDDVIVVVKENFLFQLEPLGFHISVIQLYAFLAGNFIISGKRYTHIFFYAALAQIRQVLLEICVAVDYQVKVQIVRRDAVVRAAECLASLCNERYVEMTAIVCKNDIKLVEFFVQNFKEQGLVRIC